MNRYNEPLQAENNTFYVTHVPNPSARLVEQSSSSSSANNGSRTSEHLGMMSTTHHHKDHMLSAGSSPATPYITYTVEPAKELKGEYSGFANCIHQSTLLDQRNLVDANLDAVSLGGLCDLKFPSPNHGNTSNEATSFKQLTLIEGLQNATLDQKPAMIAVITDGENDGTGPGTGAGDGSQNQHRRLSSNSITITENISLPVTSFSSLLFRPESLSSGNGTQYCTLKPVDVEVGSFLQHAPTLAGQDVDSLIDCFDMPSVSPAAVSANGGGERTVQAQAEPNLKQLHFVSIGPANKAAASSMELSCSSMQSQANGNRRSSNGNGNGNGGSLNKIVLSEGSPGAQSAKDAAEKWDYDKSGAATPKTHDVACGKDAVMRPKASNLSSECDSQSSDDDDDIIDLEIDERNGYQDTTSSHSHNSAGGGGGNSGGSNNVVGGSSSLLNGNNSNYMAALLPQAASAAAAMQCGGSAGVIGGTGVGVNVGGATGSISAGGNGEPIDFKQLLEDLCPVCNDKVSGYHYGLLTCESCKGFFKRTVQNKKVYTCVAERSCHIDKTQRKRCPFCRFQKCLDVGMKLEAVRADRMRGGRNKFGPMYKRDRARKLQQMRQRQLAITHINQALRTSIGSADIKPSVHSQSGSGVNATGAGGNGNGPAGSLGGYAQTYTNMNIKQEIQIPQVSSLTQSPDSSPSPIAVALGQGNPANANALLSTQMLAGNGLGSGSHGNGGGSSSSSSTTSSNNGDLYRSGSGGGFGGSGNCHGNADAGSLQNTSDKLCFDSGAHPSSTADALNEPLRVSPMIREFVQSFDDQEWRTQLFTLLQKQTHNQCEVDLFELMCKVLDQNLFSQVDWARNTIFFKDLKVDDQMKLLQHSWSDMLVLDHLHHRIHNRLEDETKLSNGQAFSLLSLGLLGVTQMAAYFNELQNRLMEIKFDVGDYACLKFLILLNPNVRGIMNKVIVSQGHDNVEAALLDYTLTCYPSVTDKFKKLLNILPDIHRLAERGEDHLYSKHCEGGAPTQTLLMEMLHAKRKA